MAVTTHYRVRELLAISPLPLFNIWRKSTIVPSVKGVFVSYRASDSQAPENLELLAKWRTFPDLIGSPLDDRLAGGDFARAETISPFE